MLPGSLTPADFKEAFAKNCNGVAKSKYSRMGKAPRKVGWMDTFPVPSAQGFLSHSPDVCRRINASRPIQKERISLFCPWKPKLGPYRDEKKKKNKTNRFPTTWAFIHRCIGLKRSHTLDLRLAPWSDRGSSPRGDLTVEPQAAPSNELIESQTTGHS